MDLDYLKSYYAVFRFLDILWQENEDSDFSLLLSTMNPYIWEGELPIDKTIIGDWINIFNEDSIDGKLDMDTCFQTMIKFLKKEQEYLSLNLQDLINKLKNVNSAHNDHLKIWTIWIDSYISSNNKN